jgi:3-oxoacyl-[acyl-carrier protein] reductase
MMPDDRIAQLEAKNAALRAFGEGTSLAAFTLREAHCSPHGVIVASYVRRRSPNQQMLAYPDPEQSCGRDDSRTGRDDQATGDEVPMLLEKKNAVIYGAGGAVGGAVARAFAREGARVFLTGRTRAPLDVVARDIAQAGGVAETAQLDALDQQAVERHLADVVARAGSIAISFNAISIGYQLGQFLTEMSLEAFTLPIADAMRTQFVTTTAAARHMIQQRAGVILAISATPARQPIPQTGNFGVSCAAIESLCRQLAGELGPHGIRVMCLRSAGSAEVLQELFAELGTQLGISAAAYEARAAEQTLLKRLPKLVEFANAAALMASDYASAMTGAVANVTCGATVE